jgi:hypothetical protein
MTRQSMHVRRGTIIAVAAAAVLVGAGSVFALGRDAAAPPPEKQAILDRSQPHGNAPAAPKGRGTHQPPFSEPPAPPHAGEVGTPAELGGIPVPAPPSQFTVTNMWQDKRGAVYLSIYAGSTPSDPQQGVLMVSRMNAVTGEDLAGSGFFAAPGKDGPLTLTRVRGNIVTFTSAAGSGTFNLVSDDFSS